jgi:hypothetical protein
MGFEPRILSLIVRCLDEAVENCRVIFGQCKILKLLLENSSYRGGWKKKLEKLLWTLSCHKIGGLQTALKQSQHILTNGL